MTRKVLGAVDDLLFRSKISATADALGIEALFPRSAKKLLEAATERAPDLLVLDLNSARYDPLRLLERLKASPDTRSIPVVGFLSHVQKDLAVAAREAGCDRVLARSAFTKNLPEILAGAVGEEVRNGR